MAPLPSLDDVANELDALSQDMRAYIHRETGELITLLEAQIAFMEEGEEEALAELGADDEERARLQEMAESGKWVMLPDSFEIHEWQIMRDFADSIADETTQDEVLRAIQGSGAFRYFKDTVHRRGIQDDWFAFKHEALKKIAREALEAAGIPCR